MANTKISKDRTSKRNILMTDKMWGNLNRISGRIQMETSNRTTVSDVIRIACAKLIAEENTDA